MNRFEVLAELTEQGVEFETVYRQVTQGIQHREDWATNQDYEATIAYNGARAAHELAAWENTETGDEYWDRFHEREHQYADDHGHETAELIYQRDSGALQLWLSFDTTGETLMSGTLDYYLADPIWDSETDIATQFEEYAKTIASSYAAAHLEPINEPRNNDGAVASLRVPFDYDAEELDQTWSTINTISNQLTRPFDLSEK